MKKSILFLAILAGTLASCREEAKKTMYQHEGVEEVNAIISQNPEMASNADQIARTYYAQVYPDFKNENLSVSTVWKNNLLSVELLETALDDVEIDSRKVVLVFDRPMGALHIRDVKKSWKCKGKVLFAADPCE